MTQLAQKDNFNEIIDKKLKGEGGELPSGTQTWLLLSLSLGQVC